MCNCNSSKVLTRAAASTAAKTEDNKTIVGMMDVSLGVSGAVRCHTKEDSRLRWAICSSFAFGVQLYST